MNPGPTDRLERQMRFAFEIDKLKRVLRRTRTSDNARQENSAEHSWHIALMAATLAEHANEPVDALRVAKMLLIHDLVEIDAGDTFGYDTAGHADKYEREVRAAERIFGLLPADQAAEFRALWEEFEASTTADAKFALSMDRLQAVMLNLATDGGSWKEHGVTYGRVIDRNRHIGTGSQALWNFAKRRIDEAAAKGHLPR
ncbi:MAG TPA: HD domain-containing protein [Candidatus Didemnitutus sp.]|nr:HD domain-containing protein [Candidatus Didemnitutus sp.]